MKMIKAVRLVCPLCDKRIEMDAVGLGENLTIYLLGECCGKQTIVDLEKVIMGLGGSACEKAN